jgi:hypothetical protein
MLKGGGGDWRKCQKRGNAIDEGYKSYSTSTIQVSGTYVLRRFRGRPHWGPQKGEEGILCLKDSRVGNVVEGGVEGDTLERGRQ